MNRKECFSAALNALNDRRREFDAEQSALREEIFARIPRVKQLEDEISESFSAFTAGLFNDADNIDIDAESARSIDLQQQQAELLAANGYPLDAMQPKYYCPVCKDSGFVNNERCECFKREYAKVLLESSNLARCRGEMTFDRFRLDYYGDKTDEKYKRMQTAVNVLKKYTESFGEQAHNLLFVGVPGCGKTFLSCAVGQALIEKGVFVFYTPVQDMITEFENEKFGKGQDADTSVYLDCELLIIDDLGTEFQTPFSDSVLYNVINNRINMHKPMIISTNYYPEDMQNMYHDRLKSRLLNEFITLSLPDVDVRQQKKLRKVKKN